MFIICKQAAARGLRTVRATAGLLALVFSTQTAAYAWGSGHHHSVPELDANALASGVTLLVGGALLLSERIRRR